MNTNPNLITLLEKVSTINLDATNSTYFILHNLFGGLGVNSKINAKKRVLYI